MQDLHAISKDEQLTTPELSKQFCQHLGRLERVWLAPRAAKTKSERTFLDSLIMACHGEAGRTVPSRYYCRVSSSTIC